MKQTYIKFVLFVIGLIFTYQVVATETFIIGQKSYVLNNKAGYYSIKINYPYLTGNTRGGRQFNQAVSNKVSQIIQQFKKSISSPAQLRELHQRIKMIPLNENTNTLNVNYKILNQVHNIISVRFTEGTYYYGAAHPNLTFAVLNFDLITKRVLSLGVLFKSFTTYLPTIAQYARDKLKHILLTASTQPEHSIHQSMIDDGTKPTKKNFQFWNITPDGLLISFPPYQVAAYVDGPQEVLIPYNKLKGLLARNSPLKRFLDGQ